MQSLLTVACVFTSGQQRGVPAGKVGVKVDIGYCYILIIPMSPTLHALSPLEQAIGPPGVEHMLQA